MTQSEREQQKARERLGVDSPFVEVVPERAMAYVHPTTGATGLPTPPFVEDGAPPPSLLPWGISDPEEDE